MCTNVPTGGAADPSPPSLAEVLAAWAGRTPDPDASCTELAAWFELKVDLLQPITADPGHPEHDQAASFADLAARDAKSLRDKEDGR